MPNSQIQTSCTNCRLCAKGCLLPPDLLASPRDLFTNQAGPPLDKAQLCADCGYCRQVCPQGLDLGELFRNKKTERTANKPFSVRLQQRLSFSSLFGVKSNGPASLAFMPGCALCAYSPRLLEDVYAYLRERLPDIGLLIACCAKPSLDIGDKARFAQYFAQFLREVEKMGADTILTACPNCRQMLEKYAPNLKARHLLEALDEIGLPKRDWAQLPAVALHDPCPARQAPALHQSARNILTKMRIQYREFALNREQTRCCGLGGMLDIFHPQTAHANITARARDTDCQWIVSYCQSCVQALGRSGKATLHILDYAFGREPLEPQNRQSLGGRWLNRLRAAAYARKAATWHGNGHDHRGAE